MKKYKVTMSNKKEAIFLFEQAIQTSNNIRYCPDRIWALLSIVKGFHKIDEDRDVHNIIQKALLSSQSLINKKSFSKALTKIAEVQFETGELEQAVKTLDQALEVSQKIINKQDQSDTMCKIAEIQAKMGNNEHAKQILENATQNANEISSKSGKSWALKQIAKSLAKAGEIEKAKQTAKSIFIEKPSSWAFKEIVKVQANIGEIENAIQTTENINYEYFRSWAFKEIVKVQANKGDIKNAMQTIEKIKNNYFRSWALRDVAEKHTKEGKIDQAMQILEQSLQVTEKISDKNIYLEAQSRVAKEQAKINNINKSTIILEKLFQKYEKNILVSSRSLLIFTEALARAGSIEQALYMAEKINLDEYRSWALKNIAVILATEGNVEKALQITRKINTKNIQVQAITAIGVILSKIQSISIDVEHSNTVKLNKPFSINYIFHGNCTVDLSVNDSENFEIAKVPEASHSIEEIKTIKLEIIPKKIGDLLITPLQINCFDDVEIPEIKVSVNEDLSIETGLDYVKTIQENSPLHIKFTIINNSESVKAENILIDFSDSKYDFLLKNSKDYTIDIPRILPKEKRTIKFSLIPKFMGSMAFILKTMVNENLVKKENIRINVEDRLTPGFLATELQEPKSNSERTTNLHNPMALNEIIIKRGYVHRGRLIKFNIKIENNSSNPIRNVEVNLELPLTIKCETPKTSKSVLGDIESGEILACEFLLKPTACTTANVKGYMVYKDILGEIQTLTMKGKEIETCRPNLEHLPLTFAEVTETISEKYFHKASEHIRIDGIGSADARPLLLKTAQWMNMHHVEDNGHDDQLIFVGRQKVEQTMIIARASVLGDGVKVRCYVEREDLVAGFLAEFTENLDELVASSVKPSKDMIYRLQDHFDNIDDALSFDLSKDTIFTHLNKAHEICKVVDKAVSKEIAEFVDHIHMVKEHKDRLDDADITRLKQSIDSWNEGLRLKFQ